MLVLSRKKNEEIVITDEISIVVVEIRGDKVRLGVVAPEGVAVHRREVYDAIKRKLQQAGGVGTETQTGNDAPPPALQQTVRPGRSIVPLAGESSFNN